MPMKQVIPGTNFPEYGQFDGLGLADLVRRKKVTKEELLHEAWRRLEMRNASINAVCHEFFERALCEAGTRAREGGPFEGVPFALKDLYFQLEGEPTQNGSRLWKEVKSTRTCSLVRRYQKAGLSICAKTTTSELGLALTTETAVFGQTRNPWNPALSAGGSSGGAASAVAAGIFPFAHASDSAGSIRIPASCCGLFGLKPSRGRMPMGPDRGEATVGIGTSHAVTRSVRDSAALLDISAGADVGAPFEISRPNGKWLEEIERPLRRLRIGLASSFFDGGRVDDVCMEAAQSAAQLCESLGHHVEMVRIQFDERLINTALRNVLLASTRYAVAKRLVGKDLRHDDLEPLTLAFAEEGARLSSEQLLAAFDLLNQGARYLSGIFEQVDVILTPTLAELPIELGAFVKRATNIDEYINCMLSYSPFTPIANLTGVPAATVPLSWTHDGTPVGVQFMAPFGEEGILLQLAAELELAKPWFHRIADANDAA